jgi:hypothetical protein
MDVQSSDATNRIGKKARCLHEPAGRRAEKDSCRDPPRRAPARIFGRFPRLPQMAVPLLWRRDYSGRLSFHGARDSPQSAGSRPCKPDTSGARADRPAEASNPDLIPMIGQNPAGCSETDSPLRMWHRRPARFAEPFPHQLRNNPQHQISRSLRWGLRIQSSGTPRNGYFNGAGPLVLYPDLFILCVVRAIAVLRVRGLRSSL